MADYFTDEEREEYLSYLKNIEPLSSYEAERMKTLILLAVSREIERLRRVLFSEIMKLPQHEPGKIGLMNN